MDESKFFSIQESIDQDYVKELGAMVENDQVMREKAIQDVNQFDWDLDEQNTTHLKNLIERYGFPKISTVGEGGGKRMDDHSACGS